MTSQKQNRQGTKATRAAVESARNQLRMAGLDPTIEAIRIRIGGGSNSTIISRLEEIMADEKEAKLSTTRWPAAVHSAMADALAKVKDEVALVFDSDLQEQRRLSSTKTEIIKKQEVQLAKTAEAFDAATRERDVQSSQYQATLARLSETETKLENARLEIAKINSDLEHAQHEAVSLRGRTQTLEADLAGANERNRELERDNTRLETRLEYHSQDAPSMPRRS